MGYQDYLKNKTVLITGGTGSIGTSLLDSILKLECKSIRLMSNNEHELFLAKQKYGENSKLRFLLGDVRDRKRTNTATKNVDVVFHAAALKHVPICEYNPFDAVQTNVIGTQNMIESSIDANVEKFIFISTDKATSPLSTLGATKLLAERLTIASMAYGTTSNTIMYCVRFGNVLGTRGSVFEVFFNQIKEGKSITLTNKEMTRFTMTTNDATKLILSTMDIAKGGEIFVLKMPVMKMVDFANAMIELYGKEKEIEVKEIGMRENEKFHEELISEEESIRTKEINNLFVIPPHFSKEYDKYPKLKNKYSSDIIESMEVDDIKKMLQDNMFK
jgi:UDP-N-acetylglucosamine 4,6-dehydratase/5-epimerase